jgi:hypothetical protein
LGNFFSTHVVVEVLLGHPFSTLSHCAWICFHHRISWVRLKEVESRILVQRWRWHEVNFNSYDRSNWVISDLLWILHLRLSHLFRDNYSDFSRKNSK